jgi:hypothetical protein
VIQDFAVSKILDIFIRKKIEYMISGSVASMFYGKPRMTHDIDLVVSISLDSALSLYRELIDEYYISEEGIKDALANKTMFNIIHNSTGFKIDCWILTDSEFDISRFSRKQKHKVEERDLYFSTPEDTVIIKLIWLKESGHKKHAEDITDLLRLFPGKLDYEYIWRWIEKLGLHREAGVVELPGQ